MIRIRLFLAFVLLLAAFVASQAQSRIDSLLNVLQTTEPKTVANIEARLALGDACLTHNQTAEALAHADEARKDATAINDDGLLLKANFLLTEISLRQRDFEKCYGFIYESLQLSLGANDSSGMARSYYLLGRYYRLQTILPQAMESYIKALEIYEVLHDEVGQAMCLSNLGKFSSDFRDFTTALSYFNQALDIFKKHHVTHEVYITYQLIGDVYFRMEKYTESLVYHNMALKGAEQLHDKVIAAYAYDNIANVYVAQENYEQAEAFFDKALVLATEINDSYGLAATYNDMANMYLTRSDMTKAAKYGMLSLQFAEASSNRGMVRDANFTLYTMYKKNGEWNKALKYLEAVYALNDSIYNGEKTNLVNTTRYDYDKRKQLSQLEKKEVELQIHRANLEAKKRLAYLYLALGCLAALSVVSLWRRNIHRQRVNKALSERNAAIQRLNDGLEHEVSLRTRELQRAVEKLTRRNEDLEHFSYVLSHNVRAPIAQLQGLISIIDKNKIEGEFNHDVIKRIEQASYNFDLVIHDLQNILAAQDKKLPREDVDLKQEIDRVLWGLGDEVSLQHASIVQRLGVQKIHTVRTFINSILYHLISNAIKYRHSHRHPEITISTSTQNGDISITIEDNGLGIDLQRIDPKKIFALYQRFHTHVDGKGLGLYLVKTQAEALGGHVQVASNPGTGTVFTVSLPLN